MPTAVRHHASYRMAGLKRQLLGVVRIQWALLTGNTESLDWGRRERLLGFLQRLYGMPSNDIERFVERWVARQSR